MHNQEKLRSRYVLGEFFSMGVIRNIYLYVLPLSANILYLFELFRRYYSGIIAIPCISNNCYNQFPGDPIIDYIYMVILSLYNIIEGFISNSMKVPLGSESLYKLSSNNTPWPCVFRPRLIQVMTPLADICELEVKLEDLSSCVGLLQQFGA